MHRKIGRRQAAQRSRPVLATRRRQRNLEDRTAEGIERCRAVIAGRGERGCINDSGRRPPRQMTLQPARDLRRSQRRRERAIGRESLLAKRRYQRIDRRGIGRGQIGAIESDERLRAGAGFRQRGEHAPRRIIEAHVGNLHRARDRPCVEPGRQRKLGDRGLGRHGSARIAKHLQLPQARVRQRRECIEPRVVPAVGRQHGERDAALPCKLMQGGEPIAPVGFAADQPHQHAARMCERSLDIGIDRERMAKGREIGEPQRRQACAAPAPAGGERREVAVGER